MDLYNIKADIEMAYFSTGSLMNDQPNSGIYEDRLYNKHKTDRFDDQTTSQEYPVEHKPD